MTFKREPHRLTNGPTMAELLVEADRRRANGMGVSGSAIVEALHEARAERDAQLMQIWYDSIEPYRIPDLTRDWTVESIRAARDADDPRDLG